MINQYIKLFCLFLCSAALIMLSGCYTYFEPDLESTPVVCLNSLITDGKQITVEVTRTWRYSETRPENKILDVDLRNAEVSLYIDDKFEEKMVLVSDTNRFGEISNYFEANYIPKSGDKIKIHAIDKTYGEAEAEITVPFPIDIDYVNTNIKKNDASYAKDAFSSTFDMILNVYFTDPASENNYYIFDMPTYESILYESEDSYFHVPIAESVSLRPDYSFEPIFSEHISPLETIISDAYGLYTVFSDRQFSGKQYCLEIPVHGSYKCDYTNHPDLENKLTVDIQLSHITTDYYSYMLSLWAVTEGVSGALGGVGLGDAVFEFSNVSTGAGIIAAQAVSTFKLNIHDILNSGN
ncbi:MAG: DUF4249 domain-containing protein [Bacteroides sp.]|nr:DUF4249 domain-containing protein [Bacteroides sp.]